MPEPPSTDASFDRGAPEARSELRELQQIELGILLDVARVCDELGIEFFLGEGTLLGAVRHRGFIPWDDDVDLLMRRDAYERFLQDAPERLGSRYEVQHSSTVDNYWSPLAKVRLVDGPQKFRQAHIAHLTDRNGPLLDIFPMDDVPRDHGIGLRLQSGYIRMLRGCLTQKLGLRAPEAPRQHALRLLARLMSVGFIHRQLAWAFTLHDGRPQPYVATLSSYHPVRCQVVPAEVYARSIPVEFEGHELPIPQGYDRLLRTVYGDYLSPPPAAERTIQHNFTVIDGSRSDGAGIDLG